MTPEEWRDTIGVHVELRRGSRVGSIREAARRAGISEATWRYVESGKRSLATGVTVAPSPSRSTLIAVAGVLDWPSDFADRLASGESPDDFPHPRLERLAGEASPDQLVASVSELVRAMSPDVQKLVEDVTREIVSDELREPDQPKAVLRELLEMYFSSDLGTEHATNLALKAIFPAFKQAVETTREEAGSTLQKLLDQIVVIDVADTDRAALQSRALGLPMYGDDDPADDLAYAAQDDEDGILEGRTQAPDESDPDHGGDFQGP